MQRKDSAMPAKPTAAKSKVTVPKILTFAAALKDSSRYKKRHLLLGNGFSIACRPDIFIYRKLFEMANFSTSPSAKLAFDALGTTDFERVIKSLCDAANIMRAYGVAEKIVEKVERDCVALKDLLVETIASGHPERPSDIHDDEYAACQKFLDNFEHVYSLNYDLLLYWAKMHYDDPKKITADDGFRTSYDDVTNHEESDYVVWESIQRYTQNLFFLHGALHIFDSGTEIQKFTWCRKGIRLIEQTRQALAEDRFPLFVAEGTTDEKMEKIRHNDYLIRCYKSFAGIQYCLFIHGHSLAPNDEHFLELIERGKLEHVYIGLHGDPKSDGNQQIIRRALRMVDNRTGKYQLEVSFYDSQTADVWGHV
jgi:hypothetical protein